MAQKFKVGQMVEDFERGHGTIVEHDDSSLYNDYYELKVFYDCGGSDYYTNDGRRLSGYRPTLRLTGRPFNIGDKVVIGVGKGIVRGVNDDNQFTGVMISMEENGEGLDTIWVTSDGRAWPGTPIICEHDWEEEESEKINKELDEAVKNSKAFPECQNQEKEDFDISPGFAKDWPLDHGIDDVTVSQEEIKHIVEMQNWRDVARRQDTELLKEQHKNIKNALYLVGFDTYVENAAIICECVKSVIEKGGDFSLSMANEIKDRCNNIYRGY